MYAAKIISYAQGFMLLKEYAKEQKTTLNYGGIALMWRGGCIIRSAFLGDITKAFQTNPELPNLLLDPFFTKAIHRCMPAFRRCLSQSIAYGIPAPGKLDYHLYLFGFSIYNCFSILRWIQMCEITCKLTTSAT